MSAGLRAGCSTSVGFDAGGLTECAGTACSLAVQSPDMPTAGSSVQVGDAGKRMGQTARLTIGSSKRVLPMMQVDAGGSFKLS